MEEKQMFINTSFKTAKSLKSVLGHWHANHFPIFPHNQSSISHSPQTLLANKVFNTLRVPLFFLSRDQKCPRLLPINHICLGKELFKKFKADGKLHPRVHVLKSKACSYRSSLFRGFRCHAERTSEEERQFCKLLKSAEQPT